MPGIGHIEQFDPHNPAAWTDYKTRLEFYFVANGIKDEIQVATFFSVVVSELYSIVSQLAQPKTVKELTYAEIMAKLDKYFNPKSSAVMQSYLFFTRKQQQGESVSQFPTALRGLSKDCGFGDILDSLIKVQFIIGLLDKNLQAQLLATDNLDLDKAVTMAQAYEQSVNQARLLPQNGHTVHQVQANASKPASQASKRSSTAPKRSPQTTEPPKQKKCIRCNGTNHTSVDCHYINTECSYCRKIGHLERACMKKSKDGRSKPKRSRQKTRNNQVTYESEDMPDMYSLHQMRMDSDDRFWTTPLVNSVPLRMEVDSACGLSTISLSTFNNDVNRNKNLTLKPSSRIVRQFDGTPVALAGEVTVSVQYNGRVIKLPLLVSKTSGTSLLGRNWFGSLGIRVTGINQVSTMPPVKLSFDLHQFDDVFSGPCLGANVPPIHLDTVENPQPRFCKARPVPFALQHDVEDALAQLEKQGYIEPVSHSKWATPIVVIRKKDGSIRICGDYRYTVNPALPKNIYPQPVIQEVRQAMANGVRFTKLDLRQAYQQLLVDEETAQLLTINTTKGLYKVKRLPFGPSACPAIFQRFIDTLLQGIPHTKGYFDDIFVSGLTIEEHDANLLEVLTRLQKAGLRLNRAKCTWAAESIECLGFIIDKDGFRPTKSKVEAIHNAPVPQDKKQLQAFLGLIAFYHFFIPDRASIAEPLHRLLDKNTRFNWTEEHSTAFKKLKDVITSDAILVHYDSQRELHLSCDASPYGVAAILSHKDQDGRERPIAFASRTLTRAERNYAHIDKEALAIIFGVKHFHRYVAGRSFTIHTDNKPLMGIFNPKRPIPDVLSPRMLRWALLLGAYDYQLVHRPGKDNSNADALSRLPLPSPEFQPPPPGCVLLLEAMDCPPINASEIARHSTQDPQLRQVLEYVKNGWPDQIKDQTLKPYFNRREAISLHDECLLWGSRIIVPTILRPRLLKFLHAGHWGISATKAIGRSYAWWPGMDADLEGIVRACEKCQQTRNDPSKAPPVTWMPATKPWQRLHIDLAGPFHGQNFLIVVDAYSKWLEVRRLPSTTSKAIIQALRPIFATHGLPAQVVSDNASNLTSRLIREFYSLNGIKPVTVAPAHPASNGQAERLVQVVKNDLRRLQQGDWETRLCRLMYKNHCTPSSVTGATPAELLMGRKLRCPLDNMLPQDWTPATQTTSQKISQKITSQKNTSQKHTSQSINTGKPKRAARQFQVGQPVYIKNLWGHPKWWHATIAKVTGPRSYVATTADGKQHRRHVDQVRKRHTTVTIDKPDSQCEPTIIAPFIQMENTTSSETPTDIRHTAPTGTVEHSPTESLTPSGNDSSADVEETTRETPETLTETPETNQQNTPLGRYLRSHIRMPSGLNQFILPKNLFRGGRILERD